MRFLALFPMLLLAAGFSAAEREAHRNWMDEAQDKKEDVREGLAAKDLKKVILAAQVLDRLTAKEQAFWARTRFKKAQAIAAENRTQARELLAAAKASRLEAIEKVFTNLERTCASCHDLHFEKTAEFELDQVRP